MTALELVKRTNAIARDLKQSQNHLYHDGDASKDMAQQMEFAALGVAKAIRALKALQQDLPAIIMCDICTASLHHDDYDEHKDGTVWCRSCADLEGPQDDRWLDQGGFQAPRHTPGDARRTP